MDLFDDAADRLAAERAPLAARMRPRTLDEVVGQRQLLASDRPLRSLIDQDALRSAILWGPAGTGKTTTARLIADKTSRAFESLSAVTAGVKEMRAVIDLARRRLGETGQGTILFLDEIHRLNKTQQDALLPAVEDGIVVLIGATTENPFFEINTPLMSRALLFRLEPLGEEDLLTLVDRALADERGLRGAYTITAEARLHLADVANGDARRLLNSAEVAAALAAGDDRDEITLDDAEAAADARYVAYDKTGDSHYDTISAFIKSLRGSAPDAAVYWLARMIAGGEDAKFIARRMVIFASEDVGLADSNALVVAVAAAHALEFVGLPEAQLNLSQAVIYLAHAPKSNSAATAIWEASADVADKQLEQVPIHLRGTGYPGAKKLGHGKDYVYPHDRPGHWVEQGYVPDAVAGRRYYTPSGQGDDREVEPGTGERSDGGPGGEPAQPRTTSTGEAGGPPVR